MTVLASCSPGEIRVAALQDGLLADYAVWRPGRPDTVGDVYRGRVTVKVPGLAGAFVAIVGDDGFLPDSAGAAGLSDGDAVTVQVTRAAQSGKGPRLARLPESSTSGPPTLLRAGPNAVLRLASHHAGVVSVNDPAIFAMLRPALGDRLVLGKTWDDAVDAQVDALSSRTVALPGGLRASIEPTAALVAIDMDMAAATAGREPKQPKQEAANRAALPALARQIRLRNLSGAILIDLAGVAHRRRPAFADVIREAIALDPAKPRLLGFTPGGLAEIQRPRTHPPLHEVLAGPHAAGLAALRTISRMDASRPPLLRAAPDVVSALEHDHAALPALANLLGQPLVIRSDPALSPGTVVIEERPSG